jgi:hypothetical protein
VDTLRAMVRRDEPELIAYLAEHPSWARLVLREVRDTDTALRALRRAAEAVWRIPHPLEPTDGLPNYCSPSLEDGLPVLCLDVKDNSDHAARIAEAILTALDAEGIGGRLEPWPLPGPPFDYDGRADVFARADQLRELDGRGLPPAFPEGLPVPRGWTLVMASRAREGTWQHAGWRRHAKESPFAEYLQRLQAAVTDWERHPDEVGAEEGGMHGYTFHHPGGTGAVWLHHEGLEGARRRGRGAPGTWYVTLIWQPAGDGDPAPPPLPVWLEPHDEPEEPAGGQSAEPTLVADDAGLLYENGVHALLGPLLEPGPLLRYETSFALVYAKDAVQEFTADLRRSLPGDEWLNPLLPLRHHRAGMLLDDLLKKLSDVFGGEDPTHFLDEMERCGRLTRSAGTAGGGTRLVSLTEQGHQAADDVMRRMAERHAALVDGIDAHRLAVVRHTCLQMAAKREERYRDEEGEPPDLAHDDGLLYHRGWRQFLGPLEPQHVLCLEVIQAVDTAAAFWSLPRRLHLDRPGQMLLWLYQQGDDGLPLAAVVAGLGGEDSAGWVEHGERARALTRSPGPDGDDVVRLTGRGRRGAEAYLKALTREMVERFDGIALEHLAAVRDACWRIVRAHDAMAPSGSG